LSDALGDHQVAMPVRGDKFQPLAALWRVDQAALADYIAGGGRSLWRFAAQRGVVHVAWPIDDAPNDPPAPDPFANINDPATLAAAEQHFAA
jgi:molybdopterin-guanine dinucleotide biosynthesis protein A